MNVYQIELDAENLAELLALLDGIIQLQKLLVQGGMVQIAIPNHTAADNARRLLGAATFIRENIQDQVGIAL